MTDVLPKSRFKEAALRYGEFTNSIFTFQQNKMPNLITATFWSNKIHLQTALFVNISIMLNKRDQKQPNRSQ
jgi:hypothetical protein